jgi:hypothetical protein
MDAVRRMLDRRSSVRLVGLGVVLLGLAGPILAIVLARDDRSTGDIALIELRTRDVLSAHPPLVGAYSRYGWSHPGPFIFWLFALPYRLLGNDADALRLTVLLFNITVIAVIMWLAARRGGAAWVMIAAATIALVWGLLPHSLSDGWNVTVAILPFLMTIVACWCAMCGDRGVLFIAALGFAFVFQAHIGFGLVLVPLVVVTFGMRAVRAWHADPGDRRVDRNVLVGSAVVVGVFLPVIYDSLAHWPGNIGRLAKWSLTNDEPKVGITDGLRIIGRTSSLSFLSHPQFPGRFVLTIESVATGFVPWTALVLLLAAGVISWRRGFRAEMLLCLALGLVWAAGAFAAANIAEPLLPWLIDWLQPLGWLTWAAIALVTWRVVQAPLQQAPRWARVRALGVGVVAVVFVVGTVQYTHDNVTTNYLSADSARAIDELTVGAASVGNDQPIAIVYEGEALTAGTMMNAVANQLDRRGFDLCVIASLEVQFGPSRICTGRPGEYLMVRSEPFDTPAPQGAITLAISDPLTPEERLEADTISEELAAVLISYGRDDEVFLLYSPLAGLILDGDPPPELTRETDAIQRLDRLRQIPGTRYGLYLIPVP